MKLPLHRKKLQLALRAVGSEQDHQGRLDHNWVTSECPVMTSLNTGPTPDSVTALLRVVGRHRPPSVQESL